MPSNNPDRRVSPLRASMIEDMTVRGFIEKTRQDYVQLSVVRVFETTGWVD
jgi:hypothetical protein